MKFTCQVDINLPLDRVIELFDSPDNLKEWQDDFVSFEHLSGTPGKEGAKSKLIYKMGGKNEALIETITLNDLPRKFCGTYEHRHMNNTMINRFIPLSPNQTRYESEIEYTELKGFMVRIMAFLFPSMFRKQTQKWLDQFKAFAERKG